MKLLKKMKHETKMTNDYLKDYNFTDEEIQYIRDLYEKEGINYCRRAFNFKDKMNKFTLIPLEDDMKKECPIKARKELINIMKEDQEYQRMLEKKRMDNLKKVIYKYIPISINLNYCIY